MYLEWRDVNGKVMQLQLAPDVEPVTIGRKPNVSRIFSNETTVSRDHGRIGYDDQERAYYIKDIGSANGTFVNGQQVKRANIREGDVVRCGERFEIHAKPGDAPQAATDRSAAPAERRASLPGPTMNQPGAADAVRSQLAGRTAAPELRPPERSSASAIPAVPPAQREPPAPREPLRPQPTPAATPAASAHLAEFEELRKKLQEIQTENVRLAERAARAENKIREMERNSVADEGLYDKYSQLKEHAQTLSRQLEQEREKFARKENEALESEAKVRELDRRVKESEDKGADAQERIAGLKVRVTQKDRQIEELQRQYDQLDYEARALKDQVLSLESIINDGNFSNNSYERKINMLQEIIQEKENLIQEKKAELRAKEVELRQAQMGVGISGLEDEKRKLLADFHNAIKRNDELTDRISEQSRQIDELRKELDSARQAADKKPREVDVTEHPDFRAKVRELERMREELQQAQRDLAKAELKLEQAVAESASQAGLQSELDRHKARADEVEQRLRETEGRLGELLAQPPVAAGPAITEDVRMQFADLSESITASKRNALLARDTADRLNRQRDKTGELADQVELVLDATVVLVQDLGMQERMIKTLAQDLGAE
jgi:pSer/pThr/pTyr-binding forkhead associated (FHA) protein